MRNYHLAGLSVPENRRAQVGEMFGHLFYVFDARALVVRDTYGGTDRVPLAFNCAVSASTDNSITLLLRRTTPPRDRLSLTLFRVDADALFVKSGSNLEYFKRVAT